MRCNWANKSGRTPKWILPIIDTWNKGFCGIYADTGLHEITSYVTNQIQSNVSFQIVQSKYNHIRCRPSCKSVDICRRCFRWRYTTRRRQSICTHIIASLIDIYFYVDLLQTLARFISNKQTTNEISAGVVLSLMRKQFRLMLWLPLSHMSRIYVQQSIFSYKG